MNLAQGAFSSNGDFAVTADLGLAGFDVHLYEFPEFNDKHSSIRNGEPIHVIGDTRKGSFTLSLVTDDINATVEGVAAMSAMAQECLTARQTRRAGTKVGLSDPVVLYGRAIAHRTKGTPGITG